MALEAVSSNVLSNFFLLLAYLVVLLYSGSCRVSTLVVDICTLSSMTGVVDADAGGVAFAGVVVGWGWGAELGLVDVLVDAVFVV
jgi:hypothetical protein